MTEREIIRKRIRVSIIILIAAAFLFYGAFEARKLALGPIVSIESPQNGQVVTSPDITIAGTAKNISYMTLNGLHIFTDQAGNFSEDRVLSLGYNVITLYARDKFGKETTRMIYITYQ